jgi:AcrR family transcriptional regulator
MAKSDTSQAPRRQYRLGEREKSMARTRAQILRAAEQLLADAGPRATSIDAVAAKAGVARATIYHQFGSKLGLLDAVLEDAQTRAGVHGLWELMIAERPARDILHDAIPLHCAYWAAEQDLFRLFTGLAAVDADIRAVVSRQDERWRRGISAFVARLAREGALPNGVGQKRASATLHLLLSFETFDRLHNAGELSLRATAKTLTALAAVVVDFRRPAA